MSFPPDTPPGAAAAAVAHGARGKLAPPHFAFEPVLPEAVQALLPAAAKAGLVAIVAPTGYGKTVLMSHFHRLARQRRCRCLWVTLDDRDTALGALLHLLEAARREEDGDRAAPPPQDAVPHDPLAAADALLGRLDASDARTALFIDNLAFCRDPLLPRFLERLVFGGRRRLQAVLSSVDALPLDVLRARLELGAVELAPAQLGFDRVATGRLLRQIVLPVPDEAVLDRIQARTEGWPVAVRLLQILMAGRPPPQDIAAAFDVQDPRIAAVLTRSVLAQLPPRLVAFMVEMAHVREFSAELAAHMTGHAEAGEWIDWLVRRNVLVFPLDRDHRWVRMHTLLRQHLLAEAALRLDRVRRGEILARAARWQADHGDDVAALESALEAPVPALAARLLDRVAAAVVGDQGRLGQYIGWVERLEATGAAPTIEAQAWQAWALCFTLQYERAQQAIEALDRRLGELDGGRATEQPRLRLQLRLGLLRVVVAVYQDALDTARADARTWLAQAGPRDALSVATVASGAAIATLPTGDFHAAREFMQTAAGAIARSGSDYGHAWVALISACVELADGEPAAADRLLRRARREAAGRPGDIGGVVATIDFVHARALLDLGQAGAAREKALGGLAAAARHGIGETALHGLLACVGLWRGEAEGPFAPEALARVAHSYPSRIARWLQAQQVRRLLRLERRDEALALARRHALEHPLSGLGATSAPPVLALLDIDLRIARGEMREATAALEHQIRIAQVARRCRDLIELNLQAMEIHARTDEMRKALRALTLAIATAARQRIVHPFHERIALIGQVLRDARPRDFGFIRPEEVALMDELRTACRSDADATGEEGGADGAPRGEGGARADPDAPIDALTPRERQLLGLLHDGLDNRQIADRTGLTVPTIKWHLTNTYAKLQVGNRSAALAVARARNLLPR